MRCYTVVLQSHANGAPARAETDAAVYSSTSAEKKPRFALASMR